VTRLSGRSLLTVTDPRVALPAPAAAESIRILHLGIGAFHRAHQAVFTEDAAVASGDGRWGICGVAQRSDAVVRQLRPQDCLYTVLVRSASEVSARVVGQVREVLLAGSEPDRLLCRMADPATRIVSLTVTEKGYRRSRSGGLDLQDELVRADLAGGARTVVGQLARGLQERRTRSGAPITLLACDNLTSNGRVLRDLVLAFCAALPTSEADDLAGWVEQNVAFPSCMVDRIVPATTADDRAQVARLLGLDDEALVVTEPFRQWVIEDTFAAGRPSWELAGAELVQDVTPFEQLKLRMLNGTHSMLAYLGALRGYETIAETVADDELAAAARRLMAEDVAPTLAQPPGTDVAAYGRQVLERFANPALQHRTTQVAMDGSQKLPLRLLGTVRDRLAQGGSATWAIRAVAAWMAYVAVAADGGATQVRLDDPLADRLRQAVGGKEDPASVVDSLLGVTEVFGDELRESSSFRDGLVEHVSDLLGRRKATTPRRRPPAHRPPEDS
jgi:fructuronate reductase